jgi:energy-coupling factor transport system permease protein
LSDPWAERVDYGPVRFLHRLNPLAKVGAPLPAMGLLVFSRNLALPLAFLALALLVILIGTHLRLRYLLALLVGAPVLIVVFGFTTGLWTNPAAVDRSTLLFGIGDYRFYFGSFILGLTTTLRLGSIFVLALIAGFSTTGPDLVRAMVQQLRVPYRLGYTALAAYRFVPRFGHELQIIRSAHRVRGMAGGRGPFAVVRRYLGYIVPLLAGAIRHAERVALAMDSRAFGAHRTRTERHIVPFRARDWVFLLLFWATTVALVLSLTPLELP